MKKWFATLVVIAIVAVATPLRSASDATGPSAEQALRELLDGNQRFVQHRPLHPDSQASDAPQHPLAAILSCADSRVPPELAFDQGVGRLFVVRVAGNTFDRLALESIEYAVGHLGVRLILVMGHDQCGAVTAAVKAYPDPKVGPMLENIYPAVRATQKSPGDKVSNAIDANAILVAERLRKEPELAPHVTAGELKVLPARYGLATGAVRVLSPP